jgi:YegS/Rv2252/BmrU family lipid kinase
MGWDIELWETEHPGHEVDLAARARAQGWPVVVAVGGDGTVHGVVNGMLQAGPTETVLAHVPIGTGNDFAKTVGLNKASHPERNLRSVLAGTVRHLDLGKVLGEYFVNGFGMGFAAEVVRNTFEFKRLRGFTLYLASVIRTFFAFRAPPLAISAAEHSEEGRLLMTEITIGKTAGGGFRLTPEADPTDGLLDVFIVREVGTLTFIRCLHRVMLGTHTELPPVTIFQTRRAAVTSLRNPIAVHLDGELRFPREARLVVEIEPARLAALCAA